MFEFCSSVWAKLPGKLQGGLMKERWVPGVWLGKRWSSHEHIIGLRSGKVVRVRDVYPEVDSKAYDTVMIAGILGRPSNPGASDEDRVLHEIPRALAARPEVPLA